MAGAQIHYNSIKNGVKDLQMRLMAQEQKEVRDLGEVMRESAYKIFKKKCTMTGRCDLW